MGDEHWVHELLDEGTYFNLNEIEEIIELNRWKYKDIVFVYEDECLKILGVRKENEEEAQKRIRWENKNKKRLESPDYQIYLIYKNIFENGSK
jgi:hypothetical protein